MIKENMRFWGEIDWVFKRMPQLTWGFVGNVSTEDRCLGVLDYMVNNQSLSHKLLFVIHDPESYDTAKILNKISINKQIVHNLLGNSHDIEEHKLLEHVDLYISSIDSFLKKSGENIIFDISTFPKRFFFPIVKRILSHSHLKNILISYTTPLFYSQEELSDEAADPDFIPLFGLPSVDSEKPEIAIVGVGFMPFGLPSILGEDYKNASVKLIFPFPPAAPNFQRTWEFVREMDKKCKITNPDTIIRVNSNNTSGAYDVLNRESENGTKTLLFAPYGPKPISLAMCLFACKYKTQVLYTQPHYYHPNYSEKINKVYTYCIRLNGVDLYS